MSVQNWLSISVSFVLYCIIIAHVLSRIITMPYIHYAVCHSFMLYCVFRSVRNGICVVDLSDKDRLAPNPVRTFEQAFHEFRKHFINAVCHCC